MNMEDFDFDLDDLEANPHEVAIFSKEALKLGLISQDSSIKGVTFSFDEIYEKDGKIYVARRQEDKDSKKINYVFEEKTTKISECFIIGLAYLFARKKPPENKYQAKKYLERCIYHGPASYLPFHFLFSKSLKKLQDLDAYEYGQLGHALEDNTTNPEFALSVAVKEKNDIIAKGIIRDAWKKFPNHLGVAFKYAQFLFDEDKFEECINVLTAPLKKSEERGGFEYCGSIEILVDCFCAIGKFDDAIELVTKTQLNKVDKDFFCGKILYNKKDYANAAEFFIEAIEKSYKDREICDVSLYFLIGCYIEQNDNSKTEKTLKILSEEIELNIFPYQTNYGPIAKTIFEKCIIQKLDDIILAKAKGILGTVIYKMDLPAPDDFSTKALTKKEDAALKKSLVLLKDSLEFHPDSHPFNNVYSNLLYINGRYDEALKFALKSLAFDSEEYPNIQVRLSDCSDSLKQGYANFVKNNLIYQQRVSYVAHLFDDDISTLWNDKNYLAVSELYLEFKELYEKERDGYTTSGHENLFEIAYSLNEEGKTEIAKRAYEKYLEESGPSSAVLNNLCLIYEKEENLKKAIELITQAKRLRGNDEYVNRNYKRLVIEKVTPKKKPAPIKNLPQKAHCYFDQNVSIFYYGKKSYKIQRGKTKKRPSIFATLWENREIKENNKSTKRGFLVDYPTLFSIMGVEYKPDLPGHNAVHQENLRVIINDFKRKIKEMEAPIEFECNNGYKMIIRQ